MEFDDLTNNPEQTIRNIYNHDFNNVHQYTKEDNDNIHRIKDLHRIRSIVKPVPLKAHQILGDVANQYSNLEFWRG